jgi:hypothetical protein
MVYAGVDVARNGLFWGSRGEQIMARFELVKFDTYGTGETTDAAVWGRILVDLEDSLCLISQPDAEILTVAAELRDLSRGSIGRVAEPSAAARAAPSSNTLNASTSTTCSHRWRKSVRRKAGSRKKRTGCRHRGPNEAVPRDEVMRKLPVLVEPFAGETVSSVYRRLADRNAVPTGELWTTIRHARPRLPLRTTPELVPRLVEELADLPPGFFDGRRSDRLFVRCIHRLATQQLPDVRAPAVAVTKCRRCTGGEPVEVRTRIGAVCATPPMALRGRGPRPREAPTSFEPNDASPARSGNAASAPTPANWNSPRPHSRHRSRRRTNLIKRRLSATIPKRCVSSR